MTILMVHRGHLLVPENWTTKQSSSSRLLWPAKTKALILPSYCLKNSQWRSRNFFQSCVSAWKRRQWGWEFWFPTCACKPNSEVSPSRLLMFVKQTIKHDRWSALLYFFFFLCLFSEITTPKICYARSQHGSVDLGVHMQLELPIEYTVVIVGWFKEKLSAKYKSEDKCRLPSATSFWLLWRPFFGTFTLCWTTVYSY